MSEKSDYFTELVIEGLRKRTIVKCGECGISLVVQGEPTGITGQLIYVPQYCSEHVGA